MVHCDHESKLINFILGMVSRIGKPVRAPMRERLGHSKEKESDGDTGRKEHHEVARVVEFGLFILLAQLDVSIAVGEPKDEEGKGRVGDNVEPGKLPNKGGKHCYGVRHPKVA